MGGGLHKKVICHMWQSISSSSLSPSFLSVAHTLSLLISFLPLFSNIPISYKQHAHLTWKLRALGGCFLELRKAPHPDQPIFGMYSMISSGIRCTCDASSTSSTSMSVSRSVGDLQAHAISNACKRICRDQNVGIRKHTTDEKFMYCRHPYLP